MSPKPRIAVLGAGFSGLTLAWQLAKRGDCQIEIFEASLRAGGLIQSRNEKILVESAAHSILASRDVEDLFQELGLLPLQAGFRSKAKWIFRERARKWPLSLWETLDFLGTILKSKLRNKLLPQKHETISDWALRNATPAFKDCLLTPALQGIYGAKSGDLSASLIIGGMLEKDLRPAKGKLKGSVAPQKGMQEIIERLVQKLEEKSVLFHWQAKADLKDLEQNFDAVIIAASSQGAGRILQNRYGDVAQKFLELPRLSLTTVAVGLAQKGSRISGFGCLFPASAKMHSLGVLFNSDLFQGRGELENETWIFAGDLSSLGDLEIRRRLRADRKKMSPEEIEILFQESIARKEALPVYGKELEDFLSSNVFVRSSAGAISCLDVLRDGARLQATEKPVYVTGNYLGGIGLTKILSYNKRLAERISRETRAVL